MKGGVSPVLVGVGVEEAAWRCSRLLLHPATSAALHSFQAEM